MSCGAKVRQVAAAWSEMVVDIWCLEQSLVIPIPLPYTNECVESRGAHKKSISFARSVGNKSNYISC